MAVRIFAAGLVAASLLVAPAFAQTSSTSSTSTGMTPAHTESTTTTTNKTTADTDASGKTVVHHHKVVKHKTKASKKMEPTAADASGNSM